MSVAGEETASWRRSGCSLYLCVMQSVALSGPL